MDIRLRETEGEGEQPSLLWDTEWVNDVLDVKFADWVLSGSTDPTNLKGLRAKNALNTAILLCLFTWRRAEPFDVLPSGVDPKGWWGDAIDLEDDETKIGSRLWLLLRSPLNDATCTLAEQYAVEALQPLVDQGAVARFTVTATAEVVKGWLVLDVKAYSQDGQLIYSQKFSDIWKQEFP